MKQIGVAAVKGSGLEVVELCCKCVGLVGVQVRIVEVKSAWSKVLMCTAHGPAPQIMEDHY